MESREIDSGFWHEGRQSCDEIHRLECYLRGAIPVRRLQVIENLIGKLLPGYAADFILVRDDYFKVAEQDIWKNKVLATYVNGVQVYRGGFAYQD